MSSSNPSYVDVLFDSNTRDNGTAEDYIFTLKRSINNVKKVELIKCEIPDNSYTIINGYNSGFNFDYGDAYVAQLTPGKYSPSELADEVERALNTGSGTADFTVTYNSISGLMTITSVLNSSLLFSLDQVSLNTAKTLGFPQQDTGADTTHTATYTVQSFPYFCIFLNISELGNNCLNNVNNDMITFIIPFSLTSNTTKLIRYSKEMNYTQEICLQSVRNFLSFNIILNVYGGRVFNNLGTEWYFILRFHF